MTATATAGAQSHLILTTQAAERAYRSLSGTARLRTSLRAEAGARLHWLPQELIIFDGAALDRRLEIDLAPEAELVLVEPIVFGRAAMGETLRNGALRDSIEIRRASETIYRDRIFLAGDIGRKLAQPALARGHGALATVVYAGPRAESLLPRARTLLPETGGASLLRPDFMNMRLLAPDSFLLRRALIPLLELLTQAPLPKSWSL